jgi:hypothetical protein
MTSHLTTDPGGTRYEAFSIFKPVKKAFAEAANDFLTSIAKSVCAFVADLVSGVLKYSDRGLGVNFSAAWFKDNYQHMMLGGILMGLAILIVQGIAAALRRNPTQLLTAVAATAIGVFTSFVALSLVMMVSGAIDDWCAAITNGKSTAAGTAKAIKALPDKVGAIGAVLVAILYLIFALLLFIVLVIRRLGIYVIALFIPVYAGGLGGGWTNGMVKRGAEILWVLLLTKLAIIGTFTLGVSMMVGDTKGLGGAIAAISGVVVMAFAVISPLGVMYLVAFADGMIVGQMASAGHHGRSGLAGAKNQIRGHDGHGNRTGLGRATGAGKAHVRKDQQRDFAGGRSGVIASARRGAHRVRSAAAAGRGLAGRAASGPGGIARAARARGARRATSRSGGSSTGRGTGSAGPSTPPKPGSPGGRPESPRSTRPDTSPGRGGQSPPNRPSRPHRPNRPGDGDPS